MSLASSILNEARKITWCGLWTMTLTSVAVAAGGAACMFMWRDAAQTWEARYYQAAGQLEALKAQLEQMQEQGAGVVARKEIVISVKHQGETKALQNRNFGNVKSLGKGKDWKGAIGVDAEGHVIFKNEAYGLRAAAINLLNYEKKYGINTIDALVERYCEANKGPYKKFLSKRLGIGIKEPFSIRDRLKDLLEAIVRFESGAELPEHYKDLLEVAAL